LALQIFDCMDTLYLAVNGTLMRGLELNRNMVLVGAHFLREAQTEPNYRLWSINDRHPAMMRVSQDGAAIALEVWTVPAHNMGVLLLLEPPGLCIGKVRLSDGEEVLGVLGEPFLCEGKHDITQWGGWRAYTAHLAEDHREKQGVSP
jgi:gamma-glutamylcyclotransferase (GGCT)/AIG2-like uncharacterized protein YtfP